VAPGLILRPPATEWQAKNGPLEPTLIACRANHQDPASPNTMSALPAAIATN